MQQDQQQNTITIPHDEEITKMTVPALKERLKVFSLSEKGLKAELLERLRKFCESQRRAEEAIEKYDARKSTTMKKTNDDDFDLLAGDEKPRKRVLTEEDFEPTRETSIAASNKVASAKTQTMSTKVVANTTNTTHNNNNKSNDSGRRKLRTIDDANEDDDDKNGRDLKRPKNSRKSQGKCQREKRMKKANVGGNEDYYQNEESEDDDDDDDEEEEEEEQYESKVAVKCAGNEGRIIGKGGAKIRELQDKYQVVMQMNKEQQTCEIMGDAGPVQRCLEEVEEIIEQGTIRNLEREQRRLDAAAGGGGNNNRNNRNERNNNNGGQQQQQQQQQQASNNKKEEIPCSGMEGKLIGRGGETIRRLEAESGARVKINRDRLVCEISGEPKCVQTAIRLVHEVMAGPSAKGGDNAQQQQAPRQQQQPQQQNVYGQSFGSQPQQHNIYGAAATTYGQQPQQQVSNVYGAAASTYGAHQQPVHQQSHTAIYGQPATVVQHHPQQQQHQYGQQVYQQQPTYGAPAAPVVVGVRALPPDWEEVNQGGQLYYWNTRTNLTQYERP